MKKITMRLIALALLTMFSMGAAAEIDVQIANDGKFDGGTIEVTGQEEQKDGGVKVTITVSPDSGYTIKKEAIKVYATYPPSGSRVDTRDIEIASSLTLLYNGSEKEDVEDASKYRDYTFIVPSGFGAWVKEAVFQAKSSPSKNRSKNRGGITITDDPNNPVYYLIQSYVNTAFYMRPTTGNIGNVTTLNILTDEMKWFFLNAGKVNDTQYYYICRKDGNEIKYMYFSSPNYVGTADNQRIWITLTTMPEAGSEDHYKFSIEKKNTKGWDAYNIIPKGTTNNSSLNKRGGNANDGNIQVGSGFNDEGSCWNFIAFTDYQWSLHPDCFTVTDSDDNKHYYRIQPQQSASYSIKPGKTYVMTSNTIDDDTYFYFKEAASDALMTYYYIIHVNTGHYLRFRASNVGSGDAVELVDHTGYETGDAESRFQFAVVRGSNSNETSTNPRGVIFNIVPKLLIGNNPSSQIRSVSCTNGLGKSLNTTSNRSANNTHWLFIPETYTTTCANPTITFSNKTGKVTLFSKTTSSVIYYTTDGTTPSSTNGKKYTSPFTVTAPTTIMAIVTRANFTDSEVTTKTISKVADPTIQNDGSNAIIISTTTDDAAIYYTLDGSDPTTSSTLYTTPITDVTSGVTVKAIAVKDGMINSAVITSTFSLQCAKPVIARTGNTVTITCSYPTSGVSIYYTKNGGEPTSGSTLYTESFEVAIGDVVKAIAIADGYENSEIATKNIAEELTPTDGKYLINSQSDFDIFVDMASNTESAAYHYVLKSDVTAGAEIPEPFTGVFEVDADENGNYYKISGLTHALFNTISGGSVKNVMLDNVRISEGTNVGAIANEVTGTSTNVASIYNCGVLSGRVSGSGYVGGLVGLLGNTTDNDQCYARVINCFSYADIEGGSDKGGIVGYNSFSSTASDVRTMVMNCMFYGNITGGNAAPIYGGKIIHNNYSNANNTGLNNYCYFLYDEEKVPYVKTIADDKYHGALGAEERYLNRFEFFRMTLNSTRNLAAFYAIGDATQKGEMAKWVLDKNIAPYPILKAQGKYPSVINPDAAHATTQTERNIGGKLGTLSVTISGTGSGAVFGAPSGASITTTGSLSLNITDKDYDNFNFNYRKVQLPYYNEVGTGNYTKASDGTGRVVTGWKITSITGGTAGSFTTDTYDYPSFNFVDRKCTNKDLYSVSGRVFAQGAYWEVPDGVTAITIEPYWAKAVYLSDANYDMTYNISVSGSSATANKYGVTVCGFCPTTVNGQTVYNDITTATDNLGSNASHTVYDYAVVLVGNYHQADDGAPVSNEKPVTFMSADLDGDNEPDNTLFYYHNQRRSVSPIRFDFLNIPGIGMVKRTYDSSMDPEPGILAPQGWFEVTNTVFIRFGQFEYAGSNLATKTILAPLILQGGIYEQFVSCTRTDAQNTNYLIIGDNAWFKNFANGCHTGQANKTPKVPINVTGGDYTNFYLTGIYQPNSNEASENAECYIDGGRFTEVAGSGMQQVKGNVTWLINAADITSFYGGGINAAKPITGSISTTISNSYVDEFYGGPKFGDMNDGEEVITNATDCHFGKFFGAGYGGTAFNRVGYVDDSKREDTKNWDGYVDTNYKRAYSANDGGISTNYEYEFILHSDGNQTVARFFVDYASLSLASTRNVTNTLSGCTIGTFYGGGSLGAVNGDVSSTLTNCKVTGNAFGAGFSASVPTVEVWNANAYMDPKPTYNRTANVFNNASVKTPKDNGQYVLYTWSKTYGSNSKPFTDTEDGKHYIHTDVSLDGLGAVTGNTILNIEGTTTVGGSVYGGGEESVVNKNTKVTVTGGTIGTKNEDGTYLGGADYGNVYGGGRGKADDKTAGLVKGKTDVIIENGNIYHNIYGGGAYGSVGSFNYHATTGMPTGLKDDAPEESGKCNVTVKGGTIGYNGKENGMVFGSSRGDVSTPVAGVDFNDYLAWVNETHVTIGTQGSDSGPLIKGSVYGSGENGHTYTDAEVIIHSGTIGVPEGDPLPVDVNNTPDDPTDDISMSGAHYPYRGNVYGGGCGTDDYSFNDKKYYNLIAGIVMGNTTVSMDGGHVVHNVYGAGAMGSVGTYTLDTNSENIIPDGKPISCADGTGQCTVTISGGMVGYKGASMLTAGGPDDFGHVFGAGRGEVKDSTLYENLPIVGYVNSTDVQISSSAFITGSVYGGGENGHVLGDTYVTVSGGQIGCGENKDAPYSDEDFENALDETGNVTNPLDECAHWPYETNNSPYDMYSGDTGYDTNAAKGGSKNATDGHTFYGNVFGGGSGYYPYAAGKWVRSAGLVEGNTNVTISGGHILSNVYGGNEMTDVYGSCTVTMTGGTVGVPRTWAEKRAHPVVGSLFGAGKGDKRVLFNTWTNVASTTVSVSGGRVYGSVYGGGEDGHVLGDATTTISGESTMIGTLGTTGYDGHVFGGGHGSYTALTAGVVCGNTTVNIEGGTLLGSVYGGGRLASVGTHLVPPTTTGNVQTEHKYYGKEISDGRKQIIWKYADDDPDNDEDEEQQNLTHGHITVNIKGGVIGAVDNNGKLLNSQFSIGDVFGGCKGTTNGEYKNSDNNHNNPVANAQTRLGISKSALVNMLGGTVYGSIYGGGEVGNVGEIGIVDTPEKAFAKINLLGGTVNNVFGGGLGMKNGANGATENVEALVKGDVTVNLNGLEQDDYEASLSSYVGSARTDQSYLATNGCKVIGTIFGCNNLNGTPTGHAKVHVFKTIARDGQANEGIDKVNSYDVAAVYGGGNQADYKPLASEQKQKAEVIIEGCELTSIYQVYGGGNAAATPGTVVLVKGTKNGENDYGIYEVFGGGNGVSSPDFNNPGANIGYYTGTDDAYISGEGKALVQLMAGKITYAYGGSNTKGDIRGGSNVETVNNDGGAGCCTSLLVDHMFGGGKNAAMKSGANIILGCSNSNSWVKEIYAGAENADVIGDVSLTITSGKFGRVFGGNKESGKLEGSITVNIEENRKCGIPVIIGELYGGGNQAPYSVYGYNSDGSPKTEGTNAKNPPVVNIKAFTSIGNIYGGGYGERARMYGSPTVNINEVEITHTDTDNTYSGNAYSGETVYFKNGLLDPAITQDPQDMTGIEKVVLPAHTDGKMGTILNVFGGGNAATVYGNTQVNIGTTATETLVELNDGGEPQYNTDGSPVTDDSHKVKGADIRGNVYGGGNKADVTGSTNVVVGKQATN